MKSVDPDVGSGDPMSLKTMPDADGDAYHSVWREMVLDDVVREKFVLVPEVCPVSSMTGWFYDMYFRGCADAHETAGGYYCSGHEYGHCYQPRN